MYNLLYIKIALILLMFLLLGCITEKKDIKEKPNIIFLLTDDQRWDGMGSMSNSEILTPEMDRLANEGVKFTNAFVTTPICAISRASLLSGQYAIKHGIKDFKTHFSDSAYALTYPMQLKNAGYRIGFIGKYGIGKGKDFPISEYDYWGCFPGQGNYWNKDSLGNDVHLTHILGNRAIEFLDSSPKNQPFCLSVSFKAPHSQDWKVDEFLYDTTYSELYKDKIFSTPETSESSFWNSFPESFKENNEARLRWEHRFSTEEKYQKSLRGYYRLIYGVDVEIGRIRKRLNETGRDKNTIIIFMSDNGFYLSEHGMAGKWYIHEESIRVPFIIYDPRVSREQKGIINSKMVLNIDVAPTILDYAGINIPITMQGKSVRTILYNDGIPLREEFLFEHPFKYKTIPRSQGIVTSEWKYAQFIDRMTGYEWLYHTDVDPKEKHNLADNDEYLEIKTNLKRRFEELEIELKKNEQ